MSSHSSSKESIILERRDDVVLLALNRPRQANAYDSAMLNALEQSLEDLASDTNLGALVIHAGTSAHFCAGADRGELKGRGALDGLNLQSRRVFQKLAEFPHPTVAAVRGAAAGGGLELALACDLRVACPNSTFAMPETSLDLIPAAGGCSRLSTLVGPALAKQMILFGDTLDGPRALKCGLLAQMAETVESLLPLALSWAERAAARGNLANRIAKAAIDLPAPLQAKLAFEGSAQALLYTLKATRF